MKIKQYKLLSPVRGVFYVENMGKNGFGALGIESVLK